MMQRDLFSAYLARLVQDDALQVAKAQQSWPGAEPLLRTAWQQATPNQPASGRRPPSSFGRYPGGPSQSGSSGQESLPDHKTADGVPLAQAGARTAESMKVEVFGTPRFSRGEWFSLQRSLFLWHL